jgi:predicted Abi (CAAX) family protease
MRTLARWSFTLVGVGLLCQPAPPAAAFDGSGLYQPHAEWVGRLILPTDPAWPDSSTPPRDWVWMEVQQAPPPHRALIGRRLPLTWKPEPELDRLVALVTTGVRFTPEARQAAAAGFVLPVRLDGRAAVGPLQSLAGARPSDDLLVSLEQVQVHASAATGAVLRLARPPIQVSGSHKALVQVEGPDPKGGADRFLVRHYNQRSRRFDGRRDSVRISDAPLDASGLRRPFRTQGLVGSAAGRDGWYLFGDPDRQGIFTVTALQPRALVRLSADRRIIGWKPSDAYVHQEQWDDLPRHQGQVSRAWLQPGAAAAADQLSPWKQGDEALVLHLFGGMGGPNGELKIIDDLFATGHFSFGLARVQNDSLSGEPILNIRYYQVYAHNREGTVSGSIDWTAYMGDLRRGWMNLRPVSDVLVRLDRLNLPPGAEGGGSRSPLHELALQSEVMMARYRSGDGTGYTNVGLFQSCVQDSAQALYITLERLRRSARAQPSAEPDRQALLELAKGVSGLVVPLGEVRPDWARNATVLLDWPSPDPASAVSPFRRGELADALLSRRTILPRRAQDDLARLFLRQGADLWVLRTIQIPAAPPGVVPLEPTLLEP